MRLRPIWGNRCNSEHSEKACFPTLNQRAIGSTPIRPTKNQLHSEVLARKLLADVIVVLESQLALYSSCSRDCVPGSSSIFCSVTNGTGLLLSGYSSRFNNVIEKMTDEYLYSVQVARRI